MEQRIQDPLRIAESGNPAGAPVVMIHGFTGDALTWQAIAPALAEEYRLLALELPNHGGSPHHRITSFDTLAQEITAAFDGLNLDRAHLVGHSLGGACAMALAAARPNRIASLGLLAPAGLGPSLNGDIIDGILNSDGPSSYGPALRALVHDKGLIDDSFAEAAWSLRADPNIRAAQSQMAEDLFAGSQQPIALSDTLKTLPCPTKIIWGRDDAILSWQHALNAPGHAGLHLIENMGHVPQLENPPLVSRLLLELLNSAG